MGWGVSWGSWEVSHLPALTLVRDNVCEQYLALAECLSPQDLGALREAMRGASHLL